MWPIQIKVLALIRSAEATGHLVDGTLIQQNAKMLMLNMQLVGFQAVFSYQSSKLNKSYEVY